MIDVTRRWLRRNRTGFAIGFGVLGVGYIAGQYVLSKITEARERMAGDRIAKENLRRRFQHNQEDCTITVLELLPTVSEHIIEAQPSEKILEELQHKKAQRLGRGGTSDVAPSDLSSGTPSAADEDGKSLSSFQSESYVHASQMGASSSGNGESKPPKNKAQLWSELKISSLTRAFTLLYTIALLNLLTRIQLNLLGRRNYLSSVVSLATQSPQDPTISLENRDDYNVEQACGNDFETNRKYLTFSWWLLHKGWREIMGNIEKAVKEDFGPLNPREDVSLERMSSLILDVRRKVEGATPEERKTREWLHFVLPPLDQEDKVLRDSGMSTPPPPPQAPTLQDPTSMPSPPASPASTYSISPPLRRLLDETSDIIDSPMFTHVLTLLLDATFSQLADKKLRSEAYKLPPLALEPDPAARITELTDVDPATASAKLANILAVMTKEAHKIGNGVPNEYVQAMEGVSELEGFAAVVYSSNFEFEAGFQASVSPDTIALGSGDEANPKEQRLEEMSGAEAEEASRVEKGSGIMDKAIGVVDAAWEGFESVWGKVTGRGGDSLTGAEDVRGKFVAHEGKKELKVTFASGNRYSVDYRVFAEQIAYLIEKNVVDPQLRNWMMPTFTTTTNHDTVIASILMMGSMQKYFDYKCQIHCGLPFVTLLGEKADWKLVLEKLERLKTFGEEPTQFYELLKPVISRFVKSFDEPTSADTISCWQRIAHFIADGSGPNYYSGWSTAFCFWDEKGKCMYRAGLIADTLGEEYVESNRLCLDGVEYHRVESDEVPPGYTSVPVRIDDQGDEFDAMMVAGSVGIKATSSGDSGAGAGLDTMSAMTAWWMFEKKKESEGESYIGGTA